jgi:hypothetical protein
MIDHGGKLPRMVGYSGKSLASKLGIKEGSSVALIGAPADFDLGEVPAGVRVARRLPKDPDVVVFFSPSRSAMAGNIERLGQAVFPANALWIAWPKKASKVPTDMTEDVVREVALPLGLVDTKVCAVDETWSGLKLVWRKERR